MERLLLCSVALICFFPCSPARSFDPLSDHPLDDSLTAKEIKYIGLTLRHQCLAPHLLPPLLPEAVISPTDKRWIGSLSLLSHLFPFFLPSLLPSLLSPPLLMPGFNPSLAVDACQRCNSIVQHALLGPHPTPNSVTPGAACIFISFKKQKADHTVCHVAHPGLFNSLSLLCSFWGDYCMLNISQTHKS